MGISAATGAFSGAIQQQKANAAARSLAQLKAQASIGLAGLQLDALQRADTVLSLETRRVEGKLGKPTSRGFWADLLDDADGPTIYRVQLLLWAAVLGLIFWWEVYRRLTMPKFSPTLLTLMGISGGMYLFKVPEQQ
jgi:hypothetical protein